MKSISIGLTCVFATLKLTDHIKWSWVWVVSPFAIWCIIALVIAFSRKYAKAVKRIEDQEKEDNRSKWQKRLDEIRAVREHNKMIMIVILVLCITVYSCIPAHRVTCPKPFYGKFNK
jgi:Na+/melibiose symporter-like transporter